MHYFSFNSNQSPMAASSFNQQPTFVFDSFLVPNTSNKMPSMAEPEEGTTLTATKPNFAPMLTTYECSQEIPFNARFHETNGPLLNTEMDIPIRDHQVTQMVTSNEDKNSKNVDIKEGKGKERKYNGVVRKQHLKKQKKKVAEKASPTGFVHVRARRGQATDSHSLAERARRAKISVKMKLLQSLVPGCDKITGKALILDEIIKYVQTLQSQVEFLAAKLASVTPMYNDPEELHMWLWSNNDHGGRCSLI